MLTSTPTDGSNAQGLSRKIVLLDRLRACSRVCSWVSRMGNPNGPATQLPVLSLRFRTALVLALRLASTIIGYPMFRPCRCPYSLCLLALGRFMLSIIRLKTAFPASLIVLVLALVLNMLKLLAVISRLVRVLCRLLLLLISRTPPRLVTLVLTWPSRDRDGGVSVLA